MTRYLIFPLLAAAAVACSQGASPTSLTGPTPGASTALVGDVRNSCPSAAPEGFRITSGELLGTRFKNLVQFEPVANTMRYLVELERRITNSGPLAPFDTWTLTVTDLSSALVNFERYDVPAGVYRARIRSYCFGTPQGNWSKYVEFVNGDGPFGPNVPPPPPPAPPTPDPCASRDRPGMVDPCHIDDHDDDEEEDDDDDNDED